MTVFAAVILACASLKGATVPEGFITETIESGWTEPLGLTFDANGRMYVWEKAGKVWIVQNGTRLPTPLIDLSEEVGNWRDHGLLGFALHPNFLSNGFIYLFYVVDHHHATKFGTPAYDPASNEYFTATIGRVTRYTAQSANGFNSVDPASRLVLVGESITTGLPVMDITHSIGSIAFGTDGTLLISCGDAAGTGAPMPGEMNSTAYASAGVSEGIIQPYEDVNAFRAQMIDSLAGKVLRVDPATGNGLPSNPYYDAGNPRAARSRVWALGLRNPYRMTVRPASGSTNPADGNPGVIYLGDVGWDVWEELNVIKGPGNYGWPLFEGLGSQATYQFYSVANPRAPNPLYGTSGCSQQYFLFKELVVQDGLNPASYPNPCDSSQQIAASTPRFRQIRPAFDWGRNDFGPARVGTYDGNGNATQVSVGSGGSPVAGSGFRGNCSIGGVWYTGTAFPAAYRNTYFHADWGDGWIKSFVFDSNNDPTAVQNFIAEEPEIVALAADPSGSGLYYILGTGQVKKVSYSGAVSNPPTAVATADKLFGTSPLTVQFTGSNSTSPNNLALTYSWNFGDGTPTASSANPSHTFTAGSGSPTNFAVTLTVTDTSGNSDNVTLTVSVNNTPPVVNITSPVDGTRYPMNSDTVYNLTASVSDAQHGSSALAYQWQVALHHNEHNHPEPVNTNQTATAVISPIGCDGNTYYYRITLTVTDAHGLAGMDEVFLFPDCDAPAAPGGVSLIPLSSARIQVKWTDNSTTELGFKIQRSQNGGAFAQVGSVSSNLVSFIDTGLSPSTTYAYRVLATGSTADSPFSNVAQTNTPPLAQVSLPWKNVDIGPVGPAGSAGVSDETFTVNASGGDIFDPADAFHFVYRPWTGDGAVIARVSTVENTDIWAKAGVMFRNSLAADSSCSLLFVTPNNRIGLQTRASNGGTTTVTLGTDMTPPVWLKLERTGGNVNGYSSQDGQTWTLVASHPITLGGTAFAGMAVTSHNNSTLNTSTFSPAYVRPPGTAPLLTMTKQPNGTIRIILMSEVGVTSRTDATTNFTSWLPVSTNENTGGTIEIIDPATNLLHRFYRAVFLP